MSDIAEDYVNSIKPFYQDCGSTVFSRKQMIDCYHQAEKDLALTVEDIVMLRVIYDAVDANINLGALKVQPMTRDYYELILKRFLERKKV